MKYGSTPERDFNYFSPSDPVAPYLFSHPIWYRGAWAKAIRSLMIAKHEPAPAEEFSAGHARKSFPSRLQCASAAGGSSQCRKAADFRAAKTDSCARVVFPWVCLWSVGIPLSADLKSSLFPLPHLTQLGLFSVVYVFSSSFWCSSFKIKIKCDLSVTRLEEAGHQAMRF